MRRIAVHWLALAAGAVFLVALGAAAAYFTVRPRLPASDTPVGPVRQETVPAPAASPPAVSSDARPAPSAVVVTLTGEGIRRAGIRTVRAKEGTASNVLALPAVIEAHAYKQVVVTPVSAGRVTRVLVEPGDAVTRGQPLVEVFSPELAEAQRDYVAARAELAAHERELRRTATLAEIGAASRQELEKIEAEHTARSAAVRSTRSRLTLLGVPDGAIDSLTDHADVQPTATIRAPMSGVVTDRQANPGANVDPSARLLTVADLSTVWAVAAIYEKDFARVRVGSAATVTTPAYPGATFAGRVSYIEPQVDAVTRTARARVEVPNPGGRLRLGMYAHVAIASDASSVVARVPRAALQSVGDGHVIYVADPGQAGRFVERAVQLEDAPGEDAGILAGVQPGDEVVAQGSFFLRAEVERLGLRARPSTPPGPPDAATAVPDEQRRIVDVVVTERGFEPSRLELDAGRPARIRFIRTSDRTCATELVIPALSVRRALPLDQAVVVDVTPTKGEMAFACGMNMLRGVLVAR